jgi:hypothetical protein
MARLKPSIRGLTDPDRPIFATLLPLNDAEDLRHYFHKIVDYDLDDWKEATRMATSDGRVVKSIFEEALKLMLPCTVSSIPLLNHSAALTSRLTARMDKPKLYEKLISRHTPCD